MTQRAELAARLAQRLAAPDAPMTELRDLQERLRMVDGVLAEQRAAPERRLARVLAPMVLVAVVLAIAASLPVPAVPVSLELQATSVTLELSDAATLGPLTLGAHSRIEGITSLVSPDATLPRSLAAERADTLALHSDQARLLGLTVPQGAALTVQAGRDQVQLRVESEQAPVQAEFEMRGPTELRFGDAAQPEQRDYGHGEWLRLTAGNATRSVVPPPLSLSLGRAAEGALRLVDLRPVALRFVERRDSRGAVAAVGSSLEGGTVTLPATGETVNLAAGDWLEVDGLVVERCELVAGAPLTIKLNGSARGLKLRAGEFETSLKPSWLEYTARHHRVHLLWTSAAVLWGALAWTRRQFGALR